METKKYRVRGSHRTERQIKALLGHDPQICNGFLPRGCFSLTLTEEEFELLKANDIKVTIDRRFVKK